MEKDVTTGDYVKIFIKVVICVLGLIGNILVVFVILNLKEYKKSVTHWYVLQLAIADSIFLLTLPFSIDEELNNEWKFSSGMCKGKETILFLNYYASILFLVIMSIDRYIAVCHGFSDRLQKLRTHSSAFIITAVTWIVALVICTPIMLYSDKRGIIPNCQCSYVFPGPTPRENCIKIGAITEKDIKLCLGVTSFQPTEACHKAPNTTDIGNRDLESTMLLLGNFTSFGYEFNMPSAIKAAKSSSNSNRVLPEQCIYKDLGQGWAAFLIFNFVGMFLIPLLILAYCYLVIIIKIRNTSLNTVRHSSHDATNISSVGTETENVRTRRKRSAASTRADADRTRITVMCTSLVLCFIICWLPFHAVHMAKLRGMEIGWTDGTACTILSSIGALLAYLNSALNPFLYNFIGTKFGKRIRQAGTNMNKSLRRIFTKTSAGEESLTDTSRRKSSLQTSMTKITKRSSHSHSARPSISSHADSAGHHPTIYTGMLSTAETKL